MINDFNIFFFEINNHFLNENNKDIILDEIKNFYDKFNKKYNYIDRELLNKILQVIIISIDDIFLQKSILKNQWINHTGEYHIFNTNRGGEILNLIGEDLLEKKINSWQLIMIFHTCILKDVRINKSKDLINLYNNSKNNFSLNIFNQIQKSTLQKKKKNSDFLFFLCIFSFLIELLLVELIYFFKINSYVKSTYSILNILRYIYGNS